MSNGHWLFTFARCLRLGFVGGLRLLLLSFFRPGRHDTVHARIGNGLAEVLAKVPNNHGERSAQRGLPPKHFLRLVRVAVTQRQRRVAKVRERILQRLHRLGLVVGESAESFEIQPVRWRRPQRTGNAIVRADDVGKDFTYRANALRRTPSVLLRRHGLGQASVALLVVGNSFQEFGPEARRRYSGRHDRSLMVGTLLRQAEWRQARAKYRKYKKIKTDTTHAI